MFARGKLLLTGEYAVLDGAKALALPTKYGQNMTIKKHRGSDLVWKSFDKEDKVWFQSKISLMDFSAIETTDDKKSKLLQQLLKGAVRLNSEFLSKWNGFKVQTNIDFPLNWGLGSSSSLIYLIAEWAEVNPLLLYFKVFDGSGYDVAAAGAELPILYQLSDDQVQYNEIDFKPSFTNQLYFVYLNKKQSSQKGIEHYLKVAKGRKTFAKRITELTNQIVETKDFDTFNSILKEHEGLVAETIKTDSVGTEIFSDFWGVSKSLGAWGGDFILATSSEGPEKTQNYFVKKGFGTILKYSDLFDHQ